MSQGNGWHQFLAFILGRKDPLVVGQGILLLN